MFCDIKLVGSMESGYVVSSRPDRYGTNVLGWVSAILIANQHNIPLYHLCDTCHEKKISFDSSTQIFKNFIFHKILTDYCSGTFQNWNTATQNGHHILQNYLLKDLVINNWFDLLDNCIETIGMGIPKKVRDSGLSKQWFDYFDSHAKSNGWELRWDPNNTLVIHVRLGDMANQSNDIYQEYIGDVKLQKLIEYLHDNFPHYDIHLVTSPAPQDIERCERVTLFYSYVKGVWGDDCEDYALWQMMNSKILILSRSCFSFVAGLLHQGENCFAYDDNAMLRIVNSTGKGALWQSLDIDFTYKTP